MSKHHGREHRSVRMVGSSATSDSQLSQAPNNIHCRISATVQGRLRVPGALRGTGFASALAPTHRDDTRKPAHPLLDARGESIDVRRGVVVGGIADNETIGLACHRDAGAQTKNDRRYRQHFQHLAAEQLLPTAGAGNVGRQSGQAMLRKPGQ